MTRREWFMQLGAGVVLTGCSASDLDAAELPPGVYEPSRDHLSHALAGHRLAEGSETELVQVRSPFFKPDEGTYVVILTAALLGEAPDSPVVREVADWIDLTVGESSAVRNAALALTPAHRTLAVHYYGAKTVQELEELDPQAIFREGLAWFKGGNPGESIALEAISDDRREPRMENAGTRFFTYLKARVIAGFYTSRAGLEELGRGNPNFYASPPGCKS
ncbi:MAG TPA: hypothetical protein VGP62_25510 [Bryobacteraceae bacterium]|jgi:hypothetical protein|nr:hypothetical protein [Bryobacteraceae bacterium]